MPKLTIHMDGSGSWGHAYISITSSSGYQEFAGLWPSNANVPSYVIEGNGIVRGNEPTVNPYYNPNLPQTDPNSSPTYNGDKQRYEKVHNDPTMKDTPRYDKSYEITEQQYQAVKNHITNTRNDPNYSGAFKNCTDFVQAAWKAAGFDGSFADDILPSELTQMGRAGIWSWLWQHDMNADGQDEASVPVKAGSIGIAIALTVVSAAVVTLTPIALDLSGNSRIDLLSATTATNKVFFDIDNDNFKEKVSWITGGDGWLARDSNNNGVIDNQRELFGDSDGKLAYQKLAELNTNNTGASVNSITSADTAWSSLLVWVDSNNNGVSDVGELKTLSSLGITSISLESSAGSKKGSFVQGGVTKLTQDILLNVKQENSWYMGSATEIKPETLLLPQSRGYGDVKSMHFAASENTTLLTQLKEIANLPISSLDSYYTKLLTMVYNWTGATNITANPIYGQYLDSQHLYAIERFAGIGTDFYAAQLGNNYLLRALSFKWSEGESREAGYESMISEMAVRFSAQGALKSVFGNPSYDFSTDKMVFSTSLAQIITNAKANVPTDSVDKNVYWSEIARTLKLYARDLSSTEATVKTQVDTAAGYNVTINNLGGRYFEGDAGNNTLNGNNNTNYLAGGNGNDTLTGGKGDDYLEGGTGSDLYRYASGDGNDYLCELISGSGSGATDVLQFTNLNRSSLTFSRADLNGEVAIRMNALKIDVAGGGSVLIKDHFLFDANAATNANWRVEQIKFADGTTMDFASSKAATIKLTSGNDTVNGFGDAENFNGLAGNDLIRGFAGNDTLAGGAGNDTLEGGDGNDIIIADVGKDSLRGGTGSDTFTFTNIVDNQAATADYINDFVRGTDKIDVRGLGFTGLDTDGGLTEAGELRFTSDAGGTQTITSDQNGFTFQLYSFSATTDSDFIWL